MAGPVDEQLWPRLGLDLSRAFRLALSLDRDREGVAFVDRALEGGVTWVDCGAGPGVADLERRSAAALSRSASGGASVRVSTCLSGAPASDPVRNADGRPSVGGPRPLFDGPPEDWPRALEEAVDRSGHRLGRARLSLVWVDRADAHALTYPAVRRILEAMRDEGGPIDSWGVRLGHVPEDPDGVERALAAHPPFVAFPFHLLNVDTALGFARAAAQRGTRVIATDPYAGGLLDGSWFSALQGPAPAGPLAPPSWGQLRDRFEPVRRLSYLTVERHRTLPEAALQFLWGCPEVSGVLVSARGVEQLRVALGAVVAPPLSDTERRRAYAGTGAFTSEARRATQIGDPTKPTS